MPDLREVLLFQLGRVGAFFIEYALAIFGGIIVVSLLAIAASWEWTYWSEQSFGPDGILQRTTIDRVRILQQLLLVPLGIAALALAIWRSWTAHQQARAALRQTEIARIGQNAERFSRAAELLESDRIAVRNAGVNSLFEYARVDFPASYLRVQRTLCSHIQDQSKLIQARGEEIESPLNEIAEAFLLVGRLKAIFDPDNYLRDSRLRSLYFSKSLLHWFEGGGCNFSNAAFVDCEFKQFRLEYSVMKSAVFWRSIFDGALVRYMDLRDASFRDCMLKESGIHMSDLSSSRFERLEFVGDTKFVRCILTAADFSMCPNVTSELFVKCYAHPNNPPKAPAGVVIPFEQIPDGSQDTAGEELLAFGLDPEITPPEVLARLRGTMGQFMDVFHSMPEAAQSNKFGR